MTKEDLIDLSNLLCQFCQDHPQLKDCSPEELHKHVVEEALAPSADPLLAEPTPAAD